MVLLREAEGETTVGGGGGGGGGERRIQHNSSTDTCMYLKILNLKQCLVTVILP